jgi:hypothetical protein
MSLLLKRSKSPLQLRDVLKCRHAFLQKAAFSEKKFSNWFSTCRHDFRWDRGADNPNFVAGRFS